MLLRTGSPAGTPPIVRDVFMVTSAQSCWHVLSISFMGYCSSAGLMGQSLFDKSLCYCSNDGLHDTGLFDKFMCHRAAGAMAEGDIWETI